MSEVDIDLTNDPPEGVDSYRFGATDHLAITRSDRRALDLLRAAAGAGLGFVSIVIAVLIGVRDPSDSSVSDAIVIGHALVALGLIAFGVALLGVSERWLTAGGATGCRPLDRHETRPLARQQERTG
jgi:hypothetical protein